MKLGIDVRTLMDGRYSGISQYTFNLVKKIIELNQNKKEPHELRFFYNSGKNIKNKLPDFIFQQGEVKGTRFPNKLFNYGMQKTLGLPKIDKVLGVDNFFIPHFNFIELSPGCRRILTVHDLSFLRDPRFFNWRKNVWHKLLNVERMIKEADHIITVSKNTKKDIIDLFQKEEGKISVVYSGVGKEFVPLKEKKDLIKIKEKYDLPKKFIFYLGTLEPRKNVEGIIKAFDIFTTKYKRSDYHLVIAGMKGWKSKRITKTFKEAKIKIG